MKSLGSAAYELALATTADSCVLATLRLHY